MVTTPAFTTEVSTLTTIIVWTHTVTIMVREVAEEELPLTTLQEEEET